MSQRRFIVLALAALLAISGAFYLSTQRNVQRVTEGAPLVPSLAANLGTVSLVSLRKGAATPTVTLHKQNDQWTVAERGDYPADVAKLRKLLLAVSDAKIAEEKTSNPANFPAIGLADPAQADASGTEIIIVAQDGKHTVIIGKPVGEGNFARRGGENKSFFVEPAISIESEPHAWIDSRLLDIPASTIQAIDFKPASGMAGYSLHRQSPGAQPPSGTSAGGTSTGGTSTGGASTGGASTGGAAPGSTPPASTPSGSTAPVSTPPGDVFTLTAVPAGRKALDAAALAPVPSMTSNLTAEDVAPIADIDFTQATVVILTLDDGSVVTFTGAVSGEKRWVQIKSSKQAILSAKTEGRAFELASYRYDSLFRPLEQLLVPKTPPAQPPAKPSGKSNLPTPPGPKAMPEPP